MTVADFSIKIHDLLPTFRVALTETDHETDPTGGTQKPLDLTTAASVKMIMRQATTPFTVVIDAVAAVVEDPPTAGIVRYDWVTGDTDDAGLYQAEVEIVWPGLKKQTAPTESYWDIEMLADLNNA